MRSPTLAEAQAGAYFFRKRSKREWQAALNELLAALDELEG
jgi:hypothetical protein